MAPEGRESPPPPCCHLLSSACQWDYRERRILPRSNHKKVDVAFIWTSGTARLAIATIALSPVPVIEARPLIRIARIKAVPFLVKLAASQRVNDALQGKQPPGAALNRRGMWIRPFLYCIGSVRSDLHPLARPSIATRRHFLSPSSARRPKHGEEKPTSRASNPALN